MIHTENIKVKVKSQEFFDITGKVETIVRNSEIENGICTIFAVGATSSLIINENEPMLLEDLRKSLEKVASVKGFYEHAENAYSHIRSSLFGNNQTIPIKNRELVLGTWQNIMVVNFDTRTREREVVITIVGD